MKNNLTSSLLTTSLNSLLIRLAAMFAIGIQIKYFSYYRRSADREVLLQVIEVFYLNERQREFPDSRKSKTGVAMYILGK